MERKYWTPALERAHLVLQAIVENPSRMRMMDLVKQTSVNKSTMFSLLQTMEALDWVEREEGETYRLGKSMSVFGNAFTYSSHLVERFMFYATITADTIGEAVQMSRLDQSDVVYLAKKESSSPVRLLSEPGMRIPAHTTAMGKMLLSGLPDEELEHIYGSGMIALTDNTITSISALLDQIQDIRHRGFALESEEAVIGFCCVAAPIYDQDNRMIAAVSSSMLVQQWLKKSDTAIAGVLKLAHSLSDPGSH